MNDKAKADAVMEFVNLMIGAFDVNFVLKNNPNLAEIYQVARNHVLDKYKINVPDIVSVWGADTAKNCGFIGLQNNKD